eukprot:COSAG01_NODE_18353_length_1082_cov_1.136317_1_plen_212_part_01
MAPLLLALLGSWAQQPQLGDGSCEAATHDLAAAAAAGAASDSTLALNRALRACAGRTLSPPAGVYRIDGTLSVGAAADDPARNRTLRMPPTHFHLAMGVELRRFSNASTSISPLVRVVGYRCRLTGQGGAVVSENASPMGVVHVGPGDRSVRSSIQFAYVSGIHISGRYSTEPLSPGSSSTPPAMNFTNIDENPPWTNTSSYNQCGGWPGQQ